MTTKKEGTKCAICGEYFPDKDRKWLEIVFGNALAICPTCDSNDAKKSKFKTDTLKKIPKAVKDKAEGKRKQFEEISAKSKARNIKAKSKSETKRVAIQKKAKKVSKKK